MPSSIPSPDEPPAPTALSLATSRPIVRLALRMALVVGTVLNVINQGDALLGAGQVDVLKLCLTYCVPYCVATYSATSISLRAAQSRSRAT